MPASETASAASCVHGAKQLELKWKGKKQKRSDVEHFNCRERGTQMN